MNVAAQYLLTPLSLGDSNTAEQVDIANKPRMKEKSLVQWILKLAIGRPREQGSSHGRTQLYGPPYPIEWR